MNRSSFILTSLVFPLIFIAVVHAKESPFNKLSKPSAEERSEGKGIREIKEQLEANFRKENKKNREDTSGDKLRGRYRMFSSLLNGEQKTFLLDTTEGIAYIVVTTESPEGIVYIVMATESPEPTQEKFPTAILPIKRFESLETSQKVSRRVTKEKKNRNMEHREARNQIDFD